VTWTFRQGRDRLLVGLVLLAGWELLSLRFGEYWASSPVGTATSFWHLLLSGDIPSDALFTLQETALGFAIGAPPGILLPFLLRRHAAARAVIEPYVVGAYGIPKLALTPLFLVWFGIGIGSKIALVASVSFFMLFFNTMAGVAAVDPGLIAVARVAGASERRILAEIVWPNAVPYIFAGFRTATPYAIGGAVVTELISSNRGLGYLVQYSANQFNTNNVFAALAAVLVIVIGANWAVSAIERRLLRWRPPVAASLPSRG